MVRTIRPLVLLSNMFPSPESSVIHCIDTRITKDTMEGELSKTIKSIAVTRPKCPRSLKAVFVESKIPKKPVRLLYHNARQYPASCTIERTR
jgi:hypothetical protein